MNNSPLQTALRARTDLKESVLHTFQEFAARASIYGVVRVAQSYMAMKCHCSQQTVINHLKIGEKLRIIRRKKMRVKGSAKWEINVYVFTLPWKPPTAQTSNGQNFLPKFPPQERGEEKFGSVRERIALQEKALKLLDEGSLWYDAALEEIARLQAKL